MSDGSTPGATNQRDSKASVIQTSLRVTAKPKRSEYRTLLRDCLWGLGLAVGSAAKLVTFWLLLLVFTGMLAPLILDLTRRTLHAVEHSFELAAEPQAMSAAWALGIGLALALLTQMAGTGVLKYVRARLSERVQANILNRLHLQATALPMEFFDQASSYDQLHRARFESVSQPMAMLEQSGALIQSGLILVAVSVLLARYAWWIPLALICSGLPSLFLLGQQALESSRLNRQITPQKRRAAHYSLLLTDRQSAAEIRVFGLGPHFCRARAELQQQIDDTLARLDRRSLMNTLAAGMIGWVGTLIALAWVLWQVGQFRAGVADLVMIYQSFLLSQRVLTNSLESAGSLYRASMYLADLRDFLHRPVETQPDNPQPFPAKIAKAVTVENVTFTYPGATRPCLRDLSLTFACGEISAIVGLNGAGKTTLIKLLCGFYRPDSGVIRIDGINLQDMSPRDLRAHISVLFQEAMRYNVSARDNIACGDIERQDKDVERAACAAAADGIITQLEQGYDTPLGKTMGGAELSGGEWQRLALARAFLRDAPLLLLDEPTSAMDSWTESGWFERFRDHAQGRTVVLITHRFTSARLANRIFVVDGGAVIESGTHDELLKQGGAYALAWYTQNDQQERANLASGANQPLPT